MPFLPEDKLMLIVARLRAGENPLAVEYLTTQNFTMADVETLTNCLCNIVEGYVNAPEQVRRMVRASAACHDREQALLMVAHIDAAFSEGRIAEMVSAHRKRPNPDAN